MSFLTTLPKRELDMFPFSTSWLRDMFVEDFPKVNYHSNTNVTSDEKEISIKTLAAGMKKEDINISIDNNVITISAEPVKEISWIHNNRIHKQIKLHEEVDDKKIKAKLTDGILHITLPKKKYKEKVKQIEIM